MMFQEEHVQLSMIRGLYIDSAISPHSIEGLAASLHCPFSTLPFLNTYIGPNSEL